MMRDIIVKILIKLGMYKFVVECINKVKFAIFASRMQKNGLAMLTAVDRVLSDMGVQVFLTYGTLLGAYRDHGFISYDPDIDLGVLGASVPEDMHERMAKAGFRLYRQNVLANTQTVVEETYIYRKLHLDIFYYLTDGDDYYSVIQRKHEYKDWKEANLTDGFPCDRSYVPACDFKRREFLGLQIWMPVDTDGWLRAIYSDSYMTPIKNWDAKNYKTRIVHTNERSYRRLF
ncbi:MAG: LicD family protein [Paludibacteraceae bacterium]|nr:LicD family protein [Paludibacteraceae bacterium]